MIRLNLVLLVSVMASALFLVRTQYESRRLFTEVERAMSEGRKLEVDHERLQAEKRSQATPLRVERLAKDQLQMRPASPGITQYVTLKGTGASATSEGANSAAAPAASVGAIQP